MKKSENYLFIALASLLLTLEFLLFRQETQVAVTLMSITGISLPHSYLTLLKIGDEKTPTKE